MDKQTETEQVEINRADVDAWLRGNRPTLISSESGNQKGIWEVGLDTPFKPLGETWADVYYALLKLPL